MSFSSMVQVPQAALMLLYIYFFNSKRCVLSHQLPSYNLHINLNTLFNSDFLFFVLILKQKL